MDTRSCGTAPTLTLHMSHRISLFQGDERPSRGSYCFLTTHPSEDSKPQALVHIRDILTEASPERKGETEAVTTAAGTVISRWQVFPVCPGRTGKPQRTLAGATREGVGSGSTPRGHSCLNEWMATGGGVKEPGRRPPQGW